MIFIKLTKAIVAVVAGLAIVSATKTVQADSASDSEEAKRLVAYIAERPHLTDEAGYPIGLKPVLTANITPELTKLVEQVAKTKEEIANEKKRVAEVARIAREEAEKLAREQAERAEQHRLQQQRDHEAELARQSESARILEAENAERAVREESNVNDGGAVQSSSAQTAVFSAYYPVGAGASQAEIAMQGGGVTANGHDLKSSLYYNGYLVIAAPPAYAFGTLLQIDVGGMSFIGIVADRGGAIQGNRFDIAMSDRQTCLNFGMQTGTVSVLN